MWCLNNAMYFINYPVRPAVLVICFNSVNRHSVLRFLRFSLVKLKAMAFAISLEKVRTQIML